MKKSTISIVIGMTFILMITLLAEALVLWGIANLVCFAFNWTCEFTYLMSFGMVCVLTFLKGMLG